MKLQVDLYELEEKYGYNDLPPWANVAHSYSGYNYEKDRIFKNHQKKLYELRKEYLN
jgi:hypothetical protein